MSELNPLVFWSQTDSRIALKVDLRDCEVNECTVTAGSLLFRGTGQGASGRQCYSFHINLLDQVKSTPLVTVTESRVDVVLEKEQRSWWSHLVPPTSEKLHFLRLDFDRWRSGEESDDSGDKEDHKDILSDYPDVMQHLQRQELGYSREQGKKVYLALYNILQFCGFLYIVTVLGVTIARDGHSATHEAFHAVGKVFKFCQLMQFLEVLHPLFGYTRGGLVAPLMQTSGRAIVLFLAIDTDERVQRLTIVTYLFLVWATIELVRYPHYLMRLVGVRVEPLEWLRYSLWIPLYPLGALYEALVLLRSAELMESADRFSIRLPNAVNATWDMALALRLYVLVAILPGVSYLMATMQRARRQRLRKRQ